MKTSAIQTGKKYEVNVGRGVTIVKAIGVNPKTGAYVCETLGGKEIAIGDAKRFIKAVDEGKRPKKKAAKATSCSSETPKAISIQPPILKLLRNYGMPSRRRIGG